MTDEDLLRLRGLFEVMERLRAPGGCPWDRAQTHLSLLPYLLEETYETMEAVEQGRLAGVAEELGDLLVEVAMHAAIAGEAEGFGIGDIAERATAKMVGRHPHVFGDLEVSGIDQVRRNWEELKRQEKPERESPLDGIPPALPALALAQAVLRRQPDPPSREQANQELQAALALLGAADSQALAEELAGRLLYAAVALARTHQVDAEGALRRQVEHRRQSLRQADLERARIKVTDGGSQGAGSARGGEFA
ncbi:MAG: MazG family protein [Candidatus Dormibacteria bacterium]